MRKTIDILSIDDPKNRFLLKTYFGGNCHVKKSGNVYFFIKKNLREQPQTKHSLKVIENADATPPHLEVFPAVGKLGWIAWFCEVLCDGQLSVFFQERSSA